MSLPPPLAAQLDQAHAHTRQELDLLVAVARDMAATDMDPAEQLALIGTALAASTDPWDLAGLTATAIMRLAEQDVGARS